MAQLPQADIQNLYKWAEELLSQTDLIQILPEHIIWYYKRRLQRCEGINLEEVLFPGYPDLSSSSPLFTHSSMNITLDENTTNT